MKKVSKQMRKMEAADKPEMTLGLDLGDRYSHYCLLNAVGEVLEGGRMQYPQRHELALLLRFPSAAKAPSFSNPQRTG